MAGDWIRMRTDLYRDPKVCLMADHLMRPESSLSRYVNQNCQRDMTVTRNVMRNVTVGALVTVWGVTRHRGKRVNDVDLLLRGVTLAVVDDIADLPGFGVAMQTVGWAEQTVDGVIFPNFFEEFNADPKEDTNAKNAERQRRYREKRNALRNVTVTSQSNGRIEKSRVEKSKRERETAPHSFQKPTADEVRQYATSVGKPIDADRFIDHYTANGWKVGKSPMKDWRAAVRNWHARDGDFVRPAARDVEPDTRYPELKPYE